MPNYKISGATSGSGFHAVSPNPIIPCAIVSTRPGVTHRLIWTTPPIPGITAGADANNLDLTFALRDQFGLPTINVVASSNIDDYIAGAQTGNTAGFAACIADCWIVLPTGVNSVMFRARTFGVCSLGFYIGKSFRYATRYAWNVGGFTTPAIDLSQFSFLCGRRVVACRMYACNGYFNWGMFCQWDIGAGFVDVPNANCHGDQPSQSSWPN